MKKPSSNKHAKRGRCINPETIDLLIEEADSVLANTKLKITDIRPKIIHGNIVRLNIEAIPPATMSEKVFQDQASHLLERFWRMHPRSMLAKLKPKITTKTFKL